MRKVLEGCPASSGKAKGVVRIVTSDKEISQVKKGEVVVCPFTNPSYLPIFSKASAIITDKGGMTAHAAIVSREFGVPCVTGTGKATRVLKEGDMVLVDGDKGEVFLL